MGSAQDRQSHQLHSQKKLEGKTPYQAAAEHYGEDMLNALQLRPVPPDDVTLIPEFTFTNPISRGLFAIP